MSRPPARWSRPCSRALPADAAVLVAAVADWRVEPAAEKLKKEAGPPALDWRRTPDILAGLATIDDRPRLLVGFAAETENVVAEAAAKRARKGADWIVANDVSGDVMGGDANAVHLITEADARDLGPHVQGRCRPPPRAEDRRCPRLRSGSL